jgi:hypothetical protein
LTIVISHSPVQVGVGFTTIFNQFVVLLELFLNKG